jgi:hypothetical protein
MLLPTWFILGHAPLAAALVNDGIFASPSSFVFHTVGDNTGMTARPSSGIVRNNGSDIGVGFGKWQYANATPRFDYNPTAGKGGGGALSWENGSESFGRATQHANYDGKATTGFVNISIDVFTTSLNSSLNWRFQLVGFNNDTTNFPSFSNRLPITPAGGTLLLDVTINQSALTAGAYRTVSLANNLNLGTGYDNYVWCIQGHAGANGNKTYFDNILVQSADPVSPLPPVISMTSPANGASGQAPAAFTLAADASDPDGSITQLEFFAGTTSLGVDSSAPYSVNWNNVPAGSYNLSAVATDDGGNTTPAAAVSVTVTPPPAPPTVAITSPSSGTWFAAPANLTITANASDADGTVSQVEFFSGATSLGVDSSAPYSVVWNGIPVGNYSLSAVATDNHGQSTISAPVAITVSDGLPPATVTITAPTPTARERGVYPGTFRISRSGSTNGSLTVNLSYDGNATPWNDYEIMPLSVTIPAGQSSVDLALDPVNDPIDELDKSEDVIATVIGGNGYAIGSPASATVQIIDDETFTTTAPMFYKAEVNSGSSVTLYWTDSHEDETHFKIRRDIALFSGAALTLPENIPANTTSYQVTGLTEGTNYIFTIWAEKDGGATKSLTIEGIYAVPLNSPAPPPAYKTFEQWRAFRRLDGFNREYGGTSDNPDGDTRNNLVEYLSGSDPFVADDPLRMEIQTANPQINLFWPQAPELTDAAFGLMESTDLSGWEPSPLETIQSNGRGTASDTRAADRRFYQLTASPNYPETPTSRLVGWGDSLTGNPGTWLDLLGQAPYNRQVLNCGIGGETSPQIRNRMLGLDLTSPFPAFNPAHTEAGTVLTLVADRARVNRVMANNGLSYLYALTVANAHKVEFFNFGRKIGESATPLQASVTSNIATNPTRLIASGHPFANGDLVHFTSATLPTPVNRYRPYIVRDADAEGFSLVNRDIAFDITAATDIFTPPAGDPPHPFKNGDMVRFTIAGPPVGFDGTLLYHVVNATSTGFQLSRTPGGPPVLTAYDRTVSMQPANGTVAALPPFALTQNFAAPTTAIGPFVYEWTHPGGPTHITIRPHTDRDQDTNLIFMGVNNNRSASSICQHMVTAVEHLKSMNSRFLILTLPCPSSVLDTSGNQVPLSVAPFITFNYWLRQNYPDNFVDARNALHRAYDPKSNQDVLDRDDDIIPSSLRGDPIHFNATGHAVVAAAVHKKLLERGW